LYQSGRGSGDSWPLVPHVGNLMQKGVVHDKEVLLWLCSTFKPLPRKL